MSKAKTTRAVVMELAPKKMVVYTERGEFREVRLPKIVPEIGQVVAVDASPRRGIPAFSYWTAAAALFLILALGLFNPFTAPVAAYVALDITPGIELSVNRQGTVIGTKALDASAEAILKNVNSKNSNIYDTVDNIIKEALAGGYIKKGKGDIILASVIPAGSTGAPAAVDQEKIRSIIRNGLQNQQTAAIVVVKSVDENVRREADKTGLTVNQYLVYDQARNGGYQIAPTTIRNMGVQQALNNANLPVTQLFPNDCETIWQGYPAMAPGAPGFASQPNGGMNYVNNQQPAPQQPAGTSGNSPSAQGQPWPQTGGQPQTQPYGGNNSGTPQNPGTHPGQHQQWNNWEPMNDGCP